MLAGDQEREHATAALRRHYVSGRLSVDELAHRTSIALSARSHADLRRALRDLPLGRWEPTWSVYLPGRRLVHRARRWALGLVVLAVWAVMSSVLVLLFGLALAISGPSVAEAVAFLLVWLLASGALWGAWRRATRRG
jgi:hypothetical protein